jgi:hypothetical protein
MKSCIDIRSAARNIEGGALVVVLVGIAQNRNVVREEKRERWCCETERARSDISQDIRAQELLTC